ncbi:MAG: hypothetical protein RHS_0757 [Robinsoniella sp. RHS]|nr:MAG: hypothetical protein RHS_0757 [Robinsoniella sp. RHS]
MQQWRQCGSGEIGKIECPYRSGGKDYIYMDIHKKKPYKNSCNHAKKKV